MLAILEGSTPIRHSSGGVSTETLAGRIAAKRESVGGNRLKERQIRGLEAYHFANPGQHNYVGSMGVI